MHISKAVSIIKDHFVYRCHAGRFKRMRPHEHRLECIKTFIIGHETKLLMFSVSINPSKCVIKQTHLRILIRCLKAHSKCLCMWTELINFIIVCPFSNSPSNRYKTSTLHTNKCFSRIVRSHILVYQIALTIMSKRSAWGNAAHAKRTEMKT